MSPNTPTGVVMAAALLLAAGTTDAAEYNVSVVYGHDHPLVETGYVDWAREVGKKTGGAVQFRIFFRNVLLSTDVALSGIRDTVAHVGSVSGVEVLDEIPAAATLARLSVDDTDYFVTALASTDISFNDPQIQAQWKKSGVVYAGGYGTLPARLICVVPVKDLGGLKGKRIRVAAPVHDLWARSVGAKPVEIPFRKALRGLESGAADCAVGTADEIESLRLWDAAKHLTLIELGGRWAGAQYAFSADFWRAIEAQHRRVLLDTIAEHMVKSGNAYLARAKSALAGASAKGVTVHQPAPELTQSIRSLKEQNAADAADLAKRFTAAIGKWRKLLGGIDRTDEAALVRLVKTEIFDRIDASTYGVD